MYSGDAFYGEFGPLTDSFLRSHLFHSFHVQHQPSRSTTRGDASPSEPEGPEVLLTVAASIHL